MTLGQMAGLEAGADRMAGVGRRYVAVAGWSTRPHWSCRATLRIGVALGRQIRGRNGGVGAKSEPVTAGPISSIFPSYAHSRWLIYNRTVHHPVETERPPYRWIGYGVAAVGLLAAWDRYDDGAILVRGVAMSCFFGANLIGFRERRAPGEARSLGEWKSLLYCGFCVLLTVALLADWITAQFHSPR